MLIVLSSLCLLTLGVDAPPLPQCNSSHSEWFANFPSLIVKGVRPRNASHSERKVEGGRQRLIMRKGDVKHTERCGSSSRWMRLRLVQRLVEWN